MKWMRYASIGITFLLMLACAVPVPTVEPLTPIDPVDEMQSVGREDATRAEVRLRLFSDRLSAYPSAGEDLLKARFYYNVREWSPKVKQHTQDNVTKVAVNQGIGSQIQLGKSEEYFNIWDVALAPDIPIDLGIDIGAGDARLDLGGLSLTNFGVTSGSADVILTFNTPNPEPLALLRLTSGTGKFVATGLGNANFDRLSVLGGAGTVDLDFNGAMQRSALAEIKAGAGRINIRVPATVGVRVKFSSTPISAVDTLGFREQADNIYVNVAYGQALLTLTIDITAGIGVVNLISQ